MGCVACTSGVTKRTWPIYNTSAGTVELFFQKNTVCLFVACTSIYGIELSFERGGFYSGYSINLAFIVVKAAVPPMWPLSKVNNWPFNGFLFGEAVKNAKFGTNQQQMLHRHVREQSCITVIRCGCLHRASVLGVNRSRQNGRVTLPRYRMQLVRHTYFFRFNVMPASGGNVNACQRRLIC